MSFENVRETSEAKLKAQCKKLQKKHPKLIVEVFVSTGFFKQQLNSFIKTNKVGWVVMGLTTKDRFSKFIYGSHSTDIAGKISAPVIIVPDNFKRHSLHKILLSVDNKEKLHKSSLKAFERFAKETKTKVELLHVRTEDEMFSNKLKDVLKINGKNYKIKNVSASTIEKGVGAYIQDKKADLITIISKKHSAFYGLFNESNTKRIAVTSKVPVMAIHD